MTQPTPPDSRRFCRLGRAALLATLVLAVVVAAASAPVVAQTAAPAASIDDVTYSGDGNVATDTPGVSLWQSGSHEFTVTVSATSDVDGEVCVVADATGAELACTAATVAANATEEVAVGVEQWPANLTGDQTVRVVLHAGNASDPVDQQTVPVTVIQQDGDLDGDGLTNQREVEVGTDLRNPDTDGDGLTDKEEVETYDTDPLTADTDGDGLSDGAEVNEYNTDPREADTDGDGLPDDRELAVGTNPNKPDTDGDGLDDGPEVKTHDTNATNPDTDGDGLNDGAEVEEYDTNPREADTDGDGLDDGPEVHTYDTNPKDRDTDDDGLDDGAEVNEYNTDPTDPDTDGDGLDDGAEVNTYNTNPLNPDTDGDGLQDGAEVHRYGTDPTEADTDGDGTSDRLEVDTGIVFGLRGPELVAIGVLVALALATGVFYRANGRLPGGPAAASLAARARTTGRSLADRVRGDRATTVDESDDDAPAAASETDEEEVPPEFLSNEERVLQILDAHDGRMRQSDIVEETGWSKSKVSRVLSKMEEEGQVAKIDIGRGNVVTHPNDVPSGAGSPFDS